MNKEQKKQELILMVKKELLTYRRAQFRWPTAEQFVTTIRQSVQDGLITLTEFGTSEQELESFLAKPKPTL